MVTLLVIVLALLIVSAGVACVYYGGAIWGGIICGGFDCIKLGLELLFKAIAEALE